MSSGGMLIVTEYVLTPGMRVQVDVDWPVKLHDRVPLKLVVVGTVVRSESRPVPVAGLKVSRHAFRTAGERNHWTA